MQGIQRPKVQWTSEYHTNECKITLPYREMYKLDELQQDYIINCPHRDHDSVRLMFGFKAKFDPATGQLVNKHG